MKKETTENIGVLIGSTGIALLLACLLRVMFLAYLESFWLGLLFTGLPLFVLGFIITND